MMSIEMLLKEVGRFCEVDWVMRHTVPQQRSDLMHTPLACNAFVIAALPSARLQYILKRQLGLN